MAGNNDDGVRVQFGDDFTNGIPLEQLKVETPPAQAIANQVQRDYDQAKAAGLLPADNTALFQQRGAAVEATINGYGNNSGGFFVPKPATDTVAGNIQVFQKGTNNLGMLDTTMLWAGRVVSVGLCAAVVGYGSYKLYEAFFDNGASADIEDIASIIDLF